jgi:hypothetical protein
MIDISLHVSVEELMPRIKCINLLFGFSPSLTYFSPRSSGVSGCHQENQEIVLQQVPVDLTSLFEKLPSVRYTSAPVAEYSMKPFANGISFAGRITASTTYLLALIHFQLLFKIKNRTQ